MPTPDLELLQQAVRAVGRTTGLPVRSVETTEAPPGDQETGVRVVFEPDGRSYRYAPETRRIDRLAALGLVQGRPAAGDAPRLLVAPYLSARLAERCREFGLEYIDAAGNAYLHRPGLTVLVAGQRPSADQRDAAGPRPGVGGAAALRVTFALLCWPALVSAPYREIVRVAGVALGVAGNVLADLEARGYLTSGRRRGRRRLVDPARLLEEWVINYPLKLRPRLHGARFAAGARDWWREVDLTRYGALWGGEVAADHLTGHLKPAIQTVYIPPQVRAEQMMRLVMDYRLRADPEGDLEVLDAFWNFAPDPTWADLVPPILVYADLVASLDPRNLEVARLVKEQFIDRALRPA